MGIYFPLLTNPSIYRIPLRRDFCFTHKTATKKIKVLPVNSMKIATIHEVIAYLSSPPCFLQKRKDA